MSSSLELWFAMAVGAMSMDIPPTGRTWKMSRPGIPEGEKKRKKKAKNAKKINRNRKKKRR